MKRAGFVCHALLAVACARGSVPAVAPAEPPDAARFALPFKGVGLADLPAVSSDGRRMAIAESVSDGARGSENLSLLILDVATDRVVAKLVIVDADEPQKAGRPQREAEALKWLSAEPWEPLSRLPVRPDPLAPLRAGSTGAPERATLAEGAGVTVTYREPALSVRIGSREPIVRVVKSWSVDAAKTTGPVSCATPLARMAAAYVKPGSGLLVVRVEYRGGTDLCWEPAETWHCVDTGHLIGGP